MFHKIRRTIDRVQRSDDIIKRRWVLGSSVVSMVVVIVLWTIYVDISTPSGGTSTRAERVPALAAGASTSTPGFLETFGAGVSIIFDSIKRAIYRDRTEIIKPEGAADAPAGGAGTLVPGFEPIPPTKLP